MSPPDRPEAAPTPLDGPPFDDEFDAPPSPEEMAAAAALAGELEGLLGGGNHEGEARATGDVAVALALKAAFSPADLPPARHDRLVGAAIEAARTARPAPPQPGKVVHVRFRRVAAATAFLAAAACLALVFGNLRPRAAAPTTAAAPQVPGVGTQLATTQTTQTRASRSTQELFAEPFPRQGGSSGRVDTIARARASDLRQNRFALWGVR
jgi:hypothetical protein